MSAVLRLPGLLGVGLVWLYRVTFGALFPTTCKYHRVKPREKADPEEAGQTQHRTHAARTPVWASSSSTRSPSQSKLVGLGRPDQSGPDDEPA